MFGPFAALGTLALTAASAALQALIRSLLTEKRFREWYVYGARALHKKYPTSEFLTKAASDLEKDYEAEYKEDI